MNSKSDGSAKEQMVACAVKVPGAAENMTLMSGDDRGRTYGDVHSTPCSTQLGLGRVTLVPGEGTQDTCHKSTSVLSNLLTDVTRQDNHPGIHNHSDFSCRVFLGNILFFQ